MAHDHDRLPVNGADAEKYAGKTNISIIIGPNTNSNNKMWGSMDTNERGWSLLHFILQIDYARTQECPAS